MKKLDRELGLLSVFSISTGAMLGPGIFVLPGLAYTIGGAATILAYTTAGILVIPAALSKAELSTALPESGGPYLFLDRSLGPLAGTITGLGTWISLILKSAFSLVGLGAYGLFLVGFSQAYDTGIALTIALLLILMNAVGAKKSGQVQMVLVIVTMFVLIIFAGSGSLEVRRDFYHPFFQKGIVGFLGTIAFVFVSYAGIAKVVSVAEEIKNPSRNIPWGILLSLIVTILIYTIVVYVIVGIVPGEELGKGAKALAPLVQAGEELGGFWGKKIMAFVGALALASMANAGLLAASRFPLPLARGRILPDFLATISSKFSTPLYSIILTGSILVLFVLTLPVKKLAKLASAFLLMVFGLVNIAVVIFRESEIEWYKPDFRAPLYPYLQIFGLITCLALISFMGWFPVLGALFLVAGCVGWYYTYARPRVERTGALFRSSAEQEEIELFRKARSKEQPIGESVIVPFFGLKNEDMLKVERRILLAASLCDKGERLDVVDFVEVPDQSFLSGFDPEPEAFESLKQRVQMLESKISGEIHVDQVVTHSSRGAVQNYAEEEKPHWVVFDWKKPSPWQFLLGQSKQWWLRDFPTDILFFIDRENQDYKNILVITEPGPFDGEVVYAANHIAGAHDGRVTFLNPLPDMEQDRQFLTSYQRELKSMCSSTCETETLSEENWMETAIERTRDADILILGGLTDEQFPSLTGYDPGQELAERAHCSVARIQSSLQNPRTVFTTRDAVEGDDESVEEPLPDSLLMEYLDRNCIYTDWSPEDKSDLFSKISVQLTTEQVSSEAVEAALWRRENVQSTFIDEKIAFPHAIIESYDTTRLLLVLLDRPVEYTDEGDLAQICIAIVGPPSERQTHLALIGQITNLFMDRNLKEYLLDHTDPDKIFQHLTSQLQDQDRE